MFRNCSTRNNSESKFPLTTTPTGKLNFTPYSFTPFLAKYNFIYINMNVYESNIIAKSLYTLGCQCFV